MRTAIIGGTFDPVHNGHLHLLHNLIEKTDYQRILFIPVHIPSHKNYTQRATDGQRLEMLDLALAAYPSVFPQDRSVQIICDDCEIRREGISYTFDTVTALGDRYSIEGRVAIVIGDDLLAGLPTWYRFDELKTMVDFVVFRRKPQMPPRLLPQGAYGRFIDNPVLDDSSTLIRKIITTGKMEELTSLIPQSVVQYIRNHGLYTY